MTLPTHPSLSSLLSRRRRHRRLLVLPLVAALLFQLPAQAYVVAAASAETAPAAITGVSGAELHVMSYNVQQESASTGPSWAQRRVAMKAMLDQEQPHLLGSQEAQAGQAQDILDDLGAAYGGIAVTGGMILPQLAVYYDARRLKPMSSGAFSLSEQPDVQGTRSWGEFVPRHALWVRFRDARNKREFVAVNTHLENGAHGAYSRSKAAALLRERITAIASGAPVVMTGDFNELAWPGLPVHDTLVGSGWLANTWDLADTRNEEVATWHGHLVPVPGPFRIDWVLASPGSKVRAAAINTNTYGGIHPSDHFPVQAVLTLDRRG